MSRKKQNLIFVLCLVVIGQAGIDIYLPSIPDMINILGVKAQEVQLTISLYLLGFGFSQVVYGPLSDRYGRRPVLMFGLPLFSLSCFAMVYAESMTAILILRVVQGCSIGAASVCARAIMRDTFSGRELASASSDMSIVWSLVPMLAPVCGAFISTHTSWFGSFIVLGIMGFIMTVWLITGIPETNAFKLSSLSMRKCVQGYYELVINSSYRENMIVLCFLYGIYSVVYASGPIIFQNIFDFTPAEYANTIFLITGGYLIGSYLNKRMLVIFKPLSLIKFGILTGFIVTACGLLLLMAGLPEVWILVGTIFILYLALGFLFANCVAAALQNFAANAGFASSLHGPVLFGAGACISAIYEYMFTTNAHTLLAALFLQSGAMVLCLIRLLKSNRRCKY
jgi:Bcr/CflA subfamily drug resistance transporter